MMISKSAVSPASTRRTTSASLSRSRCRRSGLIAVISIGVANGENVTVTFSFRPALLHQEAIMDSRLNRVYWTLRIGLGLAAFLAGPDKFFDILANWEAYPQ